MAIVFPINPNDNDTFTAANGSTYIYNAAKGLWAVQTTASESVAVSIGDNAPSNPVEGQQWFNTSTLKTYVYYDGQWLISNPIGLQGPTGPSGADGVDGADGEGGGTTTYADIDALVAETGMSDGDMAFVTSTNNLYIYKTNGWFKIATVENLQPGSISGVNASYDLANDGTPTVITATATDPEGFPLTWSYAVTTGSLGSTAAVSQADNVFTITPSTTEADEGSFSITFSVTDGVNGAVNAVSDFTLSFTKTITATLPGGSPTEEVLPYTSLFNGSITYNGDGPTTFTPSYDYTARFTLVGAGGGNGNYGTSVQVYSGSGGMVVADVTLSAGTTYYLYVGGGGDYGTSNGSGGFGGWPNGGIGTAGDASGGGGGGMTMLSTAPFSTSMSDSDIILIAGGGGAGTGFRNGGHGGGLTGATGQGTSNSGGTQSAGGTFNGSKLQGGDATGLRTSGSDDGGGGGGGYYGGGGGTSDASGGGGGSGYANPSLTSNVTFYMATTPGGGANGSSYGRGVNAAGTSTQRVGGNGVVIIESA